MKRKQTQGQQSVFISSTHKSLSVPPGSIEDKLLIFKTIRWKYFELLDHTIKI